MAAVKERLLARAIALGVPAALLGGAYLSQYGFGLYPCEMCWWQRYPHFAALVLACCAFNVSAQKGVSRSLPSWATTRPDGWCRCIG